jgi:hypothetical protein
MKIETDRGDRLLTFCENEIARELKSGKQTVTSSTINQKFVHGITDELNGSTALEKHAFAAWAEYRTEQFQHQITWSVGYN